MKKRFVILVAVVLVGMMTMAMAETCPTCGIGEVKITHDNTWHREQCTDKTCTYRKTVTHKADFNDIHIGICEICQNEVIDNRYYCPNHSIGGSKYQEGMDKFCALVTICLADYDNINDKRFDWWRTEYTRDEVEKELNNYCISFCPYTNCTSIGPYIASFAHTEGCICSHCGHVNHKALSNPATCTTDQTCGACHEVVVPAHHIPGPAATCTTAQYCLRDDCGEMLAPSLGGHVPGPSATCTSPQVCANGCGYVYKPATGHNYGDMTNKQYTNLGANHDVDGICPNCGESIGYKEAHIYYPNVDGGKKCPCGALNPDYVAPIPDGLNPEDGWVYENGEKSDFTGLYPYDGGLFYILNGQWQRGANGLTLIIDEFWFLANGQVQEHHGFAEYDGEWFYLDGGKLDTTASGVYGYDGKTFLVAAGRLVGECTGLAQIPSGEWYYVAEGRVLTEFSGEVEYDGKMFQIVNGKLAA